MKLYPLVLVTICMFASLAKPGKAQSLKDTVRLESIQINGIRITRNFNETRSEIDSISLAKSGTARLSELLSQNTPIFIKEYGRGAMATASFRGTAPSHTKVSWNGLELNSPMLGMVDFSLIPVYFTDEVKLMHGSSSLSESAGALGGTILLENKPDWNNHLSGKILSGLGSYRTFDEYVQISTGNSKIQSKSAFFYNSSANDFSFTNKLNATLDPVSSEYIYPVEKNRNAGYLNYGFLQEFYFQVPSNQTLTLKTWLQHNDRSIPTLLTNEGDLSSNINRQSEDALRTVAEWKLFGSHSRLTAMTAFNLQNSAYKLENRVNGAPNQVVTDAGAKIHSFINKIGYRYQFSRYLTSITGIEFNYHQVNSENHLPTSQINAYDKKRLENSLFAEFEIKLNSQWEAVLLAREQLIDFQHQSMLPLFRLTFQPNPVKPLKITASMAGNSHPPSLNDLYYFPGGNPDLRSEKSSQAEFGAIDEFNFGNNHLHTGLSLFFSGVKDWIIWLPTFQGYWEPTNIDRVTSSGIEANAGWGGTFRTVRYDLKGNYAFTQTVNQTENSPAYGNQLPYIPRNSANLNIHLAWSRLSFDWMWNYYSKRFTTTANNEETISDYLYPYFMNNVGAGMVFPAGAHKITAECKVLNIFNEEYRTVLQRPMPGRNYQFVLHYDF
ncbi:MAG: TonB-dependent receptor [Prolixibacteraceae bacterium]